MDVLGLESGVVHIVQPPVCCLAHNWCSVVVADGVERCSIIARLLESPLPDGMKHNSEADGIGQCKWLRQGELSLQAVEVV